MAVTLRGFPASGWLAGREQREIWEKSYALRRRLLRGFFLRRGSASEDAEDLAQEVYLRLLRSTGEDADAVENPEAYLFTVALTWRASMRARVVAAAAGRRRPAGRSAESEEDIEGDFERAQRWNDIRSTIARLPATTRRVMELHYRDGLDCPAISQQLQVSVHMVRKHRRGAGGLQEGAGRQELT